MICCPELAEVEGGVPIDGVDFSSKSGFDLSTVAVFFNFIPLWMSPKSASLLGAIEGDEDIFGTSGGGGGGGGGPAISGVAERVVGATGPFRAQIIAKLRTHRMFDWTNLI